VPFDRVLDVVNTLVRKLNQGDISSHNFSPFISSLFEVEAGSAG
jgi:hypothetical protein